MPCTVEEVGPCKRRLSISVDATAVKAAVEKSYRELRNSVQIPGFRRGKVPRSVLEKRFAKHVLSDVRQDLVVHGLQGGVEEHALQIVGDPKMEGTLPEVDTNHSFDFEVTVEVRPEFELPDLDGLRATRRLRQATDEEIKGVLESLRNDKAAWVPVEDEASQKDDLVIGRVGLFDENDKEVFKRDQAHVHVGNDDSLISIPAPEAMTAFNDKKHGDEVRISLTVPSEYPVKDLRDQNLEARFVVAEVKRMELPEIDDDLALAYDFDDLGTLEARIREDVNARHEQSADLEVEEEILDGLLGRCEIPLPEDGLEKAIEGSLREAIIERIYSGSFDANEQSIEQLREELAGETRTRVERSMRLWYLIEKIAKAEKIFATENDYEARIVAMARARNTTPTKIREQIAEKEAENDIRASILESKVRKWLTDKAEIAEESVDGPASKGDEAAEGSES